MEKVILAIITSVFVLTDVGAVTRIQCRIDTARRGSGDSGGRGWRRRGRRGHRSQHRCARHHSHHSFAVADAERPARTRRGCSMVSAHSTPRGRACRRRPDAHSGMDALRYAGGNTRRNQRLSPIRWKSGAARRSNPLEMARKATRRGHRQRPCSARMADGASATTDSPRPLLDKKGLEWPDSTALVISAMNVKGKLEENIHPEFDSFPAITSLPEDESFISIIPTPASEDDDWEGYVARLNSSPQGMQISPEGGSRARHEAAARKQPDRHTCLRLYPSR